jgi:hypothetical protein
MALYQNYVEQLVSAGGQSTASVPSGAANTVVKNYSGRLCRAVVTTTGTATPPANLVFFDNATTNSGTVIGNVPGNATAGQIFEFVMPAINGIVAQNVALGPVVTVSFI